MTRASLLLLVALLTAPVSQGATDIEKDRAAVVQVLLAHIRVLAPSPQGRPRVVLEQNAEAFASLLARGQRMLPGKIDELTVAVEGVDIDIAAARFSLGLSKVYLHLALRDGRWRVVNTLSYAAPAPR